MPEKYKSTGTLYYDPDNKAQVANLKCILAVNRLNNT